MESQEGVQLVVNNLTKEVGLSYSTQRDLLAGVGTIRQSYLFEDSSFTISRLSDNQKYFLSLERVASKTRDKALTIVSAADLSVQKLDALDMMTSSSRDKLAAYVVGFGFGFVYPNSNCLHNHFPDHLWDTLEGNYQIPELPEYTTMAGETAFISQQELQGSIKNPDPHREPVQFVPIKDVRLVCSRDSILKDAYAETAALEKTLRKVISANKASRERSLSTSKHSSMEVVTTHRTPAPAETLVNNHRSRSHRSGVSDSTGATTVGDASAFLSRPGSSRSSLSSAPSTAHSPPTPNVSASNGRAGRNASLVPSPPSQTVVTMKAPKQVTLAVTSRPAGTGPTRYRMLGPSALNCGINPSLTARNRGMGAQCAKSMEAVRDFSKYTWPLMRSVGWSCVWIKDIWGDNMEIFIVPGFSKFSADLIENLHYFHTRQSLAEHVEANPCLGDTWPALWERLRKSGWRKVQSRSVGGGKAALSATVCMTLGFADQYLPGGAGSSASTSSSLGNELSKGLVPGVHVFVSKAALVLYIARFPFLLKEPTHLQLWLNKFGWEIHPEHGVLWEYSAEDAQLCAKWRFRPTPCPAREWLAVDEVVRRLWLCPERVFMHAKPLGDKIPTDHLINTLRLPEREALAEETAALSPQVVGMTNDQRDQVLVDVAQGLVQLQDLTNKQAKTSTEARAKELSKLEHTVGSLLLSLKWQQKKATWSTKWWRDEAAWLAPWTTELVKQGMEPELNRDYFWTLERVAEYALQTSLHISDKLHSPLLLQPDYRPSAQDAAKEERTRTDHRLKKVARNSKNPYAAAPIAEMLESTGWLCFQDSAAAGGAHAGGDVMFVPYWKAKHFNAQNYKAGALGVDYHNSRTLLDHLEEFGNVPPKKGKTPQQVNPEQKPAVSKFSAPSTSSATTSSAHSASSPSSDTGSCSASSSADSTIMFHGVRYAAHSVEAQVRNMLDQYRHFGAIFTTLKSIGWTSVWCPKLKVKLIMPPWSYEMARAAFSENKKEVVKHELLTQDVDYFEDNDEGKAALLNYLDRRGFVRRTDDYNPSEQPLFISILLAARTPGVVVEPSFSAEGAVHFGISHHISSPEYRLLFLLYKEPLHFGRIYTVLKQEYSWTSQWVPAVGTLICASWALEMPGAFVAAEGTSRLRLVDHTALTENLDYFHDTDAGKQELMQFLRWNGIEPPTGRTLDGPAAAKAAAIATAASSPAHSTHTANTRTSRAGDKAVAANAAGPSRKRKADAPAVPGVPEVECRTVVVSSDDTANTNAARRSKRGAPLNPSVDKDMIFYDDWQPLKRAIQSGKLQLSEEHLSEQLWMSLNAHNQSWRCVEDLEQNPIFVRSEGCNAYYLSNFTEGVDYFRSLAAATTFIQQQVALLGESALLVPKKASPGLDVAGMQALQGLTIHKRSPSKACYRASDPESQFDRLVGVPSPTYSPSMYDSREDSDAEDDDNNYFTSSSYKAHNLNRAAYDVDLQEAFNVLHSPAGSPSSSQPTGDRALPDNDTQFLPLTQQASTQNERSITDLLAASAPNFERIYQCLPEGWTYTYVSHGTVMPNGERTFSPRVFLRPGRTLQDSHLVRNEDYFLSEESLIDYLRVQCGLQSMPSEISNSKKPRSTRSGIVIEATHPPGSHQHASSSTTTTTISSGMSTVGSPMVASSSALGNKSNKRAAGNEKRGRDEPSTAASDDNAGQAKRQRSSSIQSVASVSSASNQAAAVSPPLPVMTLQERIQSVRAALMHANQQSSYSGRWEHGRVPLAEISRREEFSAVKTTVAKALVRARGAAVYLFGSPGMGKTLTVVDCLDGIAQDRRDLLRAELAGASPGSSSRKGTAPPTDAAHLGYQVVWLNGASMVSKHSAYSAIADSLGWNVPAGSNLAQAIADRFSTAGQSIELSQTSVLSDIEDSASDDDADGSPSSQDTAASRIRRSFSYTCAGSSGGRQRTRRSVPMTVLVIDELDLASKEAMGHLTQLSTGATSSLVLIGMGNKLTMDLAALARRYNANAGTSSGVGGGGAVAKTVVFPVYNDTQLTLIVKHLTADLFTIMGRSMLAKKVISQSKGDVRALLRFAEISLERATQSDLVQSSLNGPSRAIVDIKEVAAACTVADKNQTVGVIESLHINARYLLIALLKHAADYKEYTPRNIVAAYNDYLQCKGLPSESHFFVMKYMEQLTDYNLAALTKKSNDPEKCWYKVSIDLDLLLQAEFGDSTAAVRAELKQIKHKLNRNNTEASLTQY